MAVILIKDTFSAILFETRGPVHGRLVVHGEVELPTPSWHPRLVLASPQGINPGILLLNLETRKPTGTEPQHVVREEVAFVRLTGPHAYGEVTILNHNGAGITINVRSTVNPNE